MPAGTYELVIEQGADLVETFTWSDETGARQPFTGWTVHAQIRTHAEALGVLLDLGPYFAIVGGVEVDGETGEALRLEVPGAVTGALGVSHAVWDLLLVRPGPPERRTYLLAGPVTVRRMVSLP